METFVGNGNIPFEATRESYFKAVFRLGDNKELHHRFGSLDVFSELNCYQTGFRTKNGAAECRDGEDDDERCRMSALATGDPLLISMYPRSFSGSAALTWAKCELASDWSLRFIECCH